MYMYNRGSQHVAADHKWPAKPQKWPPISQGITKKIDIKIAIIEIFTEYRPTEI